MMMSALHGVWLDTYIVQILIQLFTKLKERRPSILRFFIIKIRKNIQSKC